MCFGIKINTNNILSDDEIYVNNVNKQLENIISKIKINYKYYNFQNIYDENIINLKNLGYEIEYIKPTLFNYGYYKIRMI